MAWNGDIPVQANWSGNPQFAGDEVLYTTPNPANTTTNPSIGIVDGNLIPLPTSYNSLNTATLTTGVLNSTTINNSGTATTGTLGATTGNITTVNSTSINNSGNINTATINGAAVPISATNWSQYPASSNVTAPLVNNPFPLAGQSAQYDITGFRTISSNKYVGVSDNNNGTATVSTSQFNGDNIYIKGICKVGDNALIGGNLGNVEVYGGNLAVGLNALYVSGGTTLTGGALHGVEIGCKPVLGVDTTRIDVNQTGIRIKGGSLGTYISGNGLTGLTLEGESGTYINTTGGNLEVLTTGTGNNTVMTTSAGSTTINASTYADLRTPNINLYSNSVKYYVPSGDFVNNDASQIFVGSIHGAPSGAIPSTLPLRINESRGVEISNGTTWTTNTLNSTTINNSGTATTGTLNATNLNISGTTTLGNLDITKLSVSQSTSVPQDWVDTTTYALNDLVLVGVNLYISTTNGNTGNDPTGESGAWRYMYYDIETTYSSGQIVFLIEDSNFYISLENDNVGNLPIDTIGASWDLYYGFTFGLTQQGIQFAKEPGDTTTKSIVKKIGDDKVYLVTTTTTGADTFKGAIFTSPSAFNLDMGGLDIDNVHKVSSNGTLNLYAEPLSGGINIVCGGSYQLFGGNTNGGGTLVDGQVKFIAGGDVEFRSANGGSIGFITVCDPAANGHIPIVSDINGTSGRDINLTATRNAVVTSTSGTIYLTSSGGNIQSGATGYTDIHTGGALSLNSSASTSSLSANADVTIRSETSYISLVAGPSQYIFVNSKMDMSSNNIINCSQLIGSGTITVASGGTNTNVALTPTGTGLIVANKGLNMNNNNITNCPQITSPTNILIYATGTGHNLVGYADGNVQLTSTGSYVHLNSSLADVQMQGKTAASVIADTGNVTLTATAGNVVLAPVSSGFITANGNLNMTNNNISNVALLNGRNIFQYGRFYNSATQTLGATGTATRVVMNSGTGLGVSLDTTTNIGRISFAKSGTYLIEWNGYFVHGGGSATTSSIWIRLNGSSNVAGTGKRQKCDTGLNDISIGSSAQVTVSTTDYLEFVWAADGTNVPLTSIAASSPYPAIPSFSCSISIIA